MARAPAWTLYCGLFEDDLRVSTSTKQVDLIAEHVDLAIRHGDGDLAGLVAVALCQERLVPVGSPKLLSGGNRIIQASDLLKLPFASIGGLDHLVEMARSRRRIHARSTRTGAEPSQHAHRCSRRWTGGGARPHDASCHDEYGDHHRLENRAGRL